MVGYASPNHSVGNQCGLLRYRREPPGTPIRSLALDSNRPVLHFNNWNMGEAGGDGAAEAMCSVLQPERVARTGRLPGDFNRWQALSVGKGAQDGNDVDHDLGYFDDETCRLEPIANPFGPTVLPMSPE